MTSPRIVSLVPSATETVYRLGLGDALVGRSHVCNFPPEVSALPVLTRPQLASRSSRGVHDEVQSLLAEGLALFDVDLDLLRALAPTHLLVQDQCSVCAVSPADLEGALAGWLAGPRPELVRLAPHQLSDVWADITIIGDAIDRPEAARSLRKELSYRLSDLAESTGLHQKRPRVACVEWLDPVMIAGHWVPELVRLAGGEPILAEVGAPSRTLDLESLERAAPDVVVLQPCGFDLAQGRAAWDEATSLRSALSRWRDANAEPIRVALADGDAFFNRPGPRLVESAELLAEILHPTRERPALAGRWCGLQAYATS